MENILLILVGVIITILVFSFVINNLITRNIQSITEDLFHKVNKMQDKQKVIETSVNSLGELFILTEKQKDEILKSNNSNFERHQISLDVILTNLDAHIRSSKILLVDNYDFKENIKPIFSNLVQIKNMIENIQPSYVKNLPTIMDDIGKQVDSLDETLSIRKKPSKKVNRPNISPKADKLLNMTLQAFIYSGEVHQFLSLDKHNINVINRFLNLIYTYSKDIKDEKVINMSGNKLTEIKGAGKVMSDIFEEMKKEIINLK